MVNYRTFVILFLLTNSVLCCERATLYKSSSDYVSRQLDNKGQRALTLVVDLSKSIVGMLPTIGPAFSNFMGIFNDISKFFEPGGAIEQMIDDSVRRAFVEDKARSLNADIQTIKNRITAYGHSSTIESKRAELTVAIHTCERIFYLFHDQYFPLRRDRRNSPVYLKAFVPIYVSVAKLMAKVEPKYIPSLEDKMSKLRLLVQEVHGQFSEARIEDISWHEQIKNCIDIGRNIKPQCSYRWIFEDSHTGKGDWEEECKQSWIHSLRSQSYQEMIRLRDLISLN